MTAAILTLVAAVILLGGGSNLAHEGDRLTDRCAGLAMMVAGTLALVGSFMMVLP